MSAEVVSAHTTRVGTTQVECTTDAEGQMRVVKRGLRYDDGEWVARGPERVLYEGHCMDAGLVAAVLVEIFESEVPDDGE